MGYLIREFLKGNYFGKGVGKIFPNNQARFKAPKVKGFFLGGPIPNSGKT